jgi:DNA repair protein RecO (recombination protein O)
MPLVSTEAIVLHAFDYAESSRIVRLETRAVGVQSALAKGVRRPRSRFGMSLDLFVQGVAHLHLKEGRELQTLSAFEVTHARAALGADLGRFTGASALAELILHFGTANEGNPALFDALAAALDHMAAAQPAAAIEAGLAGAWHLVAQFGFAPSLHACSICHTPVKTADLLPFSHAVGGVVCSVCAIEHTGGRPVPAAARERIAIWSAGGHTEPLDPREARAHQRLLREFLQEHLADGRRLRAFEAWEHGGWSTP